MRVCLPTLFLFLCLQGFSADSQLVVDRGLPQSNLNNVSGAARSNVRWGNDGFIGDDFTIGAAGEHWVIDSIRTWAVPGGAGDILPHLGDYYQDVRLYFGRSDVTPVSTGQLTAGSDETTNANIRASDASQNGTLLYDDFGTPLHVWQIDFTSLNLPAEGGVKYSFGVWGNGRSVPGTDDKVFTWYNHASNASLSGGKQDGADGTMLIFDAAGRLQNTHETEGNGWDKNSDINVQVFAHRVDSQQSGKASAK